MASLVEAYRAAAEILAEIIRSTPENWNEAAVHVADQNGLSMFVMRMDTVAAPATYRPVRRV